MNFACQENTRQICTLYGVGVVVIRRLGAQMQTVQTHIQDTTNSNNRGHNNMVVHS